MMAKKKEEIVLKEQTLEVLKRMAPGCFLCAMIIEDFEKNGKLTGASHDFMGDPTFPVSGMVLHVEVERKIAQGRGWI